MIFPQVSKNFTPSFVYYILKCLKFDLRRIAVAAVAAAAATYLPSKIYFQLGERERGSQKEFSIKSQIVSI